MGGHPEKAGRRAICWSLRVMNDLGYRLQMSKQGYFVFNLVMNCAL